MKTLPFSFNHNHPELLKTLAKANRTLGELKGYSKVLPNQHILINAMTLNEAKDSSEIEHIVTTHDELYKAMGKDDVVHLAAKEVLNYRRALWHGFEFVQKRGFIHTNLMIEIHDIIDGNRPGIRTLPGTKIMNPSTNEVIFIPPESYVEIISLLKNLESYINKDYDVDPLIQLSIMHYQFETIHPFYDGNGRTGRVLNILFLVLKGLLDSPILYLSKYILKEKKDYYLKLNAIQNQEEGAVEEWIIYMLNAVHQTADETLKILMEINEQIDLYTERLKEKLPKLYSKDLVEALFYEFYTKTYYLEDTLGISRRTAITYLKQLEEEGFLESEMIGRERIYKNTALFDLLKETNSAYFTHRRN
ncbi:Fic family protein [Macrococcus equi]|uniref:Fic family protein n=1 Tax=Macrococcus equi TaxID=3395462 RepID=UPI0039BDC847